MFGNFTTEGTGHYLWWGVAPKRNVFRGKTFADPTSNINSKINTHPLAKNVTKGYHSVVTDVLYHFCDTSLITDCKMFCSLKFQVVCTCTFFGDTICLPTNRKMIKIVTLIDSHIVLTYDNWNCFQLVSNISVSHALEINFYYPTLELFCFLFAQPFTYSKFSLPTLFSSVPPPAINNDRSLTPKKNWTSDVIATRKILKNMSGTLIGSE